MCMFCNRFFRREKIGNHFIKPDNVYEEIWNLVDKSLFSDAVLTSIGSDSYVDLGIGGIDQICIDSGNGIILHWYCGNLLIYVGRGEGMQGISYVYYPATNTLYGEREESYLIEKFLPDYYEVAGKKSKYSFKNQGTYTFVYVESVFRELP